MGQKIPNHPTPRQEWGDAVSNSINWSCGGEPSKGRGRMMILTIQGDAYSIALFMLILISMLASTTMDKR